MKHPEHRFIVKRDFGPGFGWGYIGEDTKTLDDCADAILDSFASGEMQATADTVLVLEIDGAVALNRTDDALADCAASLTARDMFPSEWSSIQGDAA